MHQLLFQLNFQPSQVFFWFNFDQNVLFLCVFFVGTIPIFVILVCCVFVSEILCGGDVHVINKNTRYIEITTTSGQSTFESTEDEPSSGSSNSIFDEFGVNLYVGIVIVAVVVVILLLIVALVMVWCRLRKVKKQADKTVVIQTEHNDTTHVQSQQMQQTSNEDNFTKETNEKPKLVNVQSISNDYNVQMTEKIGGVDSKTSGDAGEEDGDDSEKLYDSDENEEKEGQDQMVETDDGTSPGGTNPGYTLGVTPNGNTTAS